MARFRFLGSMAELAGTRQKEIALEKPTRLGELFPMPFPAERTIILVNERPADLDDLIRDEDEVLFMQVLSGG
jgi:molybdopterin converting factor small subunit